MVIYFLQKHLGRRITFFISGIFWNLLIFLFLNSKKDYFHSNKNNEIYENKIVNKKNYTKEQLEFIQSFQVSFNNR